MCGFKDSGFVSAGYPLCHLPKDAWVQNGAEIVGGPGSSSGYGIALSSSGNYLVAAGHRNNHEAYVYDKSGSQWKLRSSFSLRSNDTDPTTYFDLTRIHIREVNRGQVNNPRSLAPLEVSFLTNSSNSLQIHRCEEFSG